MKLLYAYHHHTSAIIAKQHCAKTWDCTFYRVVENQSYMGNKHSMISLALILVLNDLILSVLSVY